MDPDSVRPVDMPLVRDELVTAHSLVTPDHVDAVTSAAGFQLSRQLKDIALKESKNELSRLSVAELFYVTVDMSDLAQAAACSLPQFTLMPEDLPAEYGLVLFENSLRNERGEAVVRAATWGRCWRTDANPSLTINWYSDTKWLIEGPGVTEQTKEFFDSGFTLTQMYLITVPFSVEPVDDYGSAMEGRSITFSETGGGGLFLSALKTVWMLMGQTLASVELAHYQRSDYRRIARAGGSVSPVRIISLRRQAGERGNSETDREYVHRWIVRGHWRRQWYPARAVHRPVWIAPHIKGPEGAPLLGGEKVYSLQR